MIDLSLAFLALTLVSIGAMFSVRLGLSKEERAELKAFRERIDKKRQRHRLFRGIGIFLGVIVVALFIGAEDGKHLPPATGFGLMLWWGKSHFDELASFQPSAGLAVAIGRLRFFGTLAFLFLFLMIVSMSVAVDELGSVENALPRTTEPNATPLR